MADTTLAPITSIRQLRLTESQQREFAAMVQNPTTTTRATLEEFYRRVAPTANVSALTNQAIAQYFPQQQAPQTTNTQTAIEPSGIGDVGTAVAAGAFVGLTADRSGREQLIADVNRVEAAKIFDEGELYEKVQNAMRAGDEDTARQLLHVDTIFDSQMHALTDSVGRAQADASVLVANHQLLKDKRNKPTTRRAQKRKEEHQAQEIKKINTLLQVLKAGKNEKGQPLSEKEKKGRFLRFVQLQQGYNNHDLYDALSRKRKWSEFWRLQKPSILSRKTVQTTREALLAKEKEEQAIREATTKQQPQETPVLSQPLPPPPPEEPFYGPQQQFPQPSVSAGPAGSRVGLPSINLPGIPGGSYVGRTLLLNPEAWPIIGIFLGLFILIAVIIAIIIMLSNTGAGPLQLVQLSCGNQPTQQYVGSTLNIDNYLEQQFHVGFSLDGFNPNKVSDPVKDPGLLSIEMGAYNTICILFGQTTGSTYVQTKYNTFGKDLVGNYGAQGGQPFGKTIVFTALVSTKDHVDCSVELMPRSYPEDTNNPSILWNFYAPDKCFSIYEFQFRIAHALGLSLLYQQEYLATTQGKPKDLIGTIRSVFPDFNLITLQHGPLPTFSCTNAVGTQDFLPDCFADMVGEYLTYPYYLDSGLTDATAIIPPSPVLLTDCTGVPPITLPGITLTKELLPSGRGTTGQCVTPNYIVLHTTNYYYDGTAQALYQDFLADPQGRNVGSNYGIGQKGDIVQMAETYMSKVTMTYSVYGWFDVISIELVEGKINYDGCPGMPGNVPPQEQYDAALNLVAALMKQYNIPMGRDTSWQSSSGLPSDNPPPRGVYGHFQLNTTVQGNPGDPGKTFLTCFRADLQKKFGL